MVTQGYTGAHKGTQGHIRQHRGTQGHTGAHRGTQGQTRPRGELLPAVADIASVDLFSRCQWFIGRIHDRHKSKCNTSWCHWVCSLLLNELRVSMVHVLLLEVLQLPLCLLLLCCILLKRLSMRFKYRQLRLV